MKLQITSGNCKRREKREKEREREREREFVCVNLLSASTITFKLLNNLDLLICNIIMSS